MKRLMPLIVGAIVALCLCGVLSIALAPGSSTPAQPAQPVATPTLEVAATPVGFITRDTLKPWPFTVDAGMVLCTEERHILFVAGGVRYALNGTAKDAMAAGAAYQDVSTIWADDPQNAGAKIDLQPVINIGQEICQQRN